MEGFNPELCDERHGDIKAMFKEIFLRLKKVENRFLAIMTALVFNLFGIVGILIAVLVK